MSGQIRTRKRDEKVKLDPETFRDELVKAINGCEELGEVQANLVKLGNVLDYRRYAHEFLDTFIAGGILDAGGSVKPCEVGKAKFYVFASEGSDEEIKEYATTLSGILAPFQYLREILKDDHLPKVLGFIKAFSQEDRDKLAKFSALLTSAGVVPADVLKKVFNSEAMTRDDTAEKFIAAYFQAWLRNDTINSLIAAFKRAGLDTRLEELFPANKRSFAYMRERFQQYEGLESILAWQASVRNTNVKKELLQELVVAIKEDKSNDELIEMVNTTMQEQFLKPIKMLPVVFGAVFGSVSWNKKFDILTDQSLKLINKYNKLMRAYTQTEAAQVLCLQRLQAHMVDNQQAMKLFGKLVLLMYKLEIVSEDAVMEWYHNSHQKGHSLLAPMIEPMIKWFATAEEEE